jgi:hypothetical protein
MGVALRREWSVMSENPAANPAAASWALPGSGGTSGTVSRPQPAAAKPATVTWVQLVRPGIIPLRPLTVTEILDGAIAVVRLNPRTVLGLSALVVAIKVAIATGLTLLTDEVSLGPVGAPIVAQLGSGSSSVIGLLLAALVGAVLTGMLVIVASEAVLGRTVRAGEVWRRIRRRIFPLLVAAVIAGLVPWLGLVLCVVPGVLLWAAWSLTTPALVLERLGPFAALGRSWKLVMPDFFRVWGIRALSFLMYQLILLVVAGPFYLVGILFLGGNGSLFGDSAQPLPFVVLTSVGAVVAGTIAEPFLAGTLALLYIDRRMRAEALDMTLQDTAAADAGEARP